MTHFIRPVFILAGIITFLFSFAQVGINTNNSNPNPSAMLDVQSTDKGILIPRMTTLQRTSISNPANGLLVFDSQTESFWFFASGSWSELKDSSSGSQISDSDGNTIIDVEASPNEDKIRFQVAGKEIGLIDSTHFDLVFPDSSTIIGHLAGNENAIISYPSEDDQGKFNTFFGLKSGFHNNPDPNICSSYNLWEIYENGCGSHNTFLGNKSGLSNTFGRHNLFIGSRAGLNNLGDYFFSPGQGGPGSENTFLGFMSGQFNANGYWNTFVGAYSGEENGRGIPNFGENCSHNTYIGVFAGRFNRDGRHNTYIGTEAGGGWDSNTGERNVYLGRRAGYGNTGDENVFVGTDAGYSYDGEIIPGYRNTFIGNEAGFFSEGSDNVFIGNMAGYFEDESNKLYIANNNTNNPLIYGDFAAATATINGNLGIGVDEPSEALQVNGTFQCINGDITGLEGQQGVHLRTNEAGGYVQLDVGGYGHSYDHIILGEASGGNVNNVGIGTNSPTARLEVNSSVVKKVGGGSWTASSDRRLKKDISDYNEGLNEVLAIHPVNFRYNKLSGYDTKKEHIGVIAQEIEEVAPHMVSTYEKEGEEYLQVDNSAMTYMLINAVKEQQEQIEDLKSENELLRAEKSQMKDDISQIKTMLEMSAQK